MGIAPWKLIGACSIAGLLSCASTPGGSEDPGGTVSGRLELRYDSAARAVVLRLTNSSGATLDYYDSLSANPPWMLALRIRGDDGRLLTSDAFDKDGFVSSTALLSSFVVPPVALRRLEANESIEVSVRLDQLLTGMERYVDQGHALPTGGEVQFRWKVCFDPLLTQCDEVTSEWFTL